MNNVFNFDEEPFEFHSEFEEYEEEFNTELSNLDMRDPIGLSVEPLAFPSEFDETALEGFDMEWGASGWRPEAIVMPENGLE